MTEAYSNKHILQLNDRNSRDIQREFWCFLNSVHAFATADEGVREKMKLSLENSRMGFLNYFSRPVTEIAKALEDADE